MTAFNEWIKEPLTADRFERASHLLISHMATEYGVTVNKDDLTEDGLHAFRLAVLTDEGIDLSRAANELMTVNSGVADQAKARKLAADIRAAETAPEHLARLNPAQRMELGRKMKAEDNRREAAAKAEANSDGDKAMKLAAIMAIKSPSARLELARSWNLA